MLRGCQPLSTLLSQPDRGIPGLTTCGPQDGLQLEGPLGGSSKSTYGGLRAMTARSAPFFDGPYGPTKPDVGSAARTGESSRTVRSATEGANGESTSKALKGRADLGFFRLFRWTRLVSSGGLGIRDVEGPLWLG